MVVAEIAAQDDGCREMIRYVKRDKLTSSADGNHQLNSPTKMELPPIGVAYSHLSFERTDQFLDVLGHGILSDKAGAGSRISDCYLLDHRATGHSNVGSDLVVVSS